MSTTPSQLAAGPAPPVEETGYARRYRWFVLVMLTLVAIVNFVDRQLMSILMEPIKAEFALSDTQLGFLTGFAFAIFYAIMGIPLARLADQGNRRKLIAVVIALWSVMTAACGLATGFITLLIARIGVGIGEAGSAPAVQSLIGDYFEPRRRATAIALQSTGVYIGILLGFLLGGWIGEFAGWRTAFIAVGLPGVLFALIFAWVVREPPRGRLDNVVDTGKAPPFRETLQHLWSRRSYRHLPLAVSLYAFVAYGSMAWAPSFFIRTHGMALGEVGTWLALSAGVAGGLGCIIGGLVSDHVVNRTGDPRWHVWIPAILIAASIPLYFAIYLSPTPLPALLLTSVTWFLGNTWLGPIQATLQGLSGVRTRGMAIAIMLFVNNLVGLGLGPQVVGILSDVLQPSTGVDSLRYALIIALVGASALSALHFVLAARTLRADLHAR
jgi:predicted MFS family arabinose efflux permease